MQRVTSLASNHRPDPGRGDNQFIGLIDSEFLPRLRLRLVEKGAELITGRSDISAFGRCEGTKGVLQFGVQAVGDSLCKIERLDRGGQVIDLAGGRLNDHLENFSCIVPGEVRSRAGHGRFPNGEEASRRRPAGH